MPYADPDRQREAVRDAVRRHRRARPAPGGNTSLPGAAGLDLTTVEGLTGAMAAILRDLLTQDMDAAMRARACGYVVQTQLQCLQLGQLADEVRLVREMGEKILAAGGARSQDDVDDLPDPAAYELSLIHI